MNKAIVLDLDGTVYVGNKALPGAEQAILNMRNQGYQVLFCTNNSSSTPNQIRNKLANMNISCEVDEIITSGMMVVDYIKNNGLNNIYISGPQQFIDYCLDNGVHISNEHEADVLVISMDTNINYQKLTKLTRAALHSKFIIACNEDKLFQKEDGLYPGCGAIVSSVLYCSNKTADLIIGKPNTFMMNYISNRFQYSPLDIIMIGDSYDSDIIMANNYGCRSVLIGNDQRKKECISSLSDTSSWDWSSLFN